jgi:hypothetical protein
MTSIDGSDVSTPRDLIQDAHGEGLRSVFGHRSPAIAVEHEVAEHRP